MESKDQLVAYTIYYFQVIYARFGSKPHIMMIFFALLTNLLIAGMVMSEGSVIMATLTDGKIIYDPFSLCTYEHECHGEDGI